MVTILSTLVSLLAFRVRSRASLELELVALRHQVTVMRRQHPGRLRLFSTDRLLWVWLYRIWPQVLNAMVSPVIAGRRLAALTVALQLVNKPKKRVAASWSVFGRNENQFA